MFKELLIPIDNFMSFVLKNKFIALFPIGGGWTIIALASFYILAFAALVVLYFVLRLAHSGMYASEVSIEFAKRHIATGAVFALMALVNPKGWWNVLAILSMACWVSILFALIGSRIASMKNPPHGKIFYWIIGVEFAVWMFLIGIIGAMTMVGAVLLAVTLLCGVAVCGSGIGSLTGQHSSGGYACTGSTRPRRVELEDGTEIEENGINWKDVNSSDTYRENFDGTYSRN